MSFLLTIAIIWGAVLFVALLVVLIVALAKAAGRHPPGPDE